MDTSLVYFEGPWSTAERDPVMNAGADIEADLSFVPSNGFDRPWVGTHQSVGGHDLYMTTRQNADSALMDRSATGLAERMRWLGRRIDAEDIRIGT